MVLVAVVVGYLLFKGWYWSFGNKKPPNAVMTYIYSKIYWVIAGGFLSLLILIESSEAPSGLKILIGLILSALIVLVMWVGFDLDRERGNYEAIHKATLEYWHKQNEKYGIKEKS